MLTALNELWNSDVCSNLALSAESFKSAIDSIKSSVPLNLVLKHAVLISSSRVQQFDLVKLLDIYFEQLASLRRKDVIFLLAYVAVHRHNFDNMNKRFRNGLEHLLDETTFENLLSDVESLNKTIVQASRTKMSVTDMKEVFEEVVAKKLRQVKAIDLAKELGNSTINTSKFTCATAFNACLLDPTIMHFDFSQKWRIGDLFNLFASAFKSEEADQVVLGVLANIVSNLWNSGLSENPVPVACKVIRLYKACVPTGIKSTADINVGIFQLLLETDLGHIKLGESLPRFETVLFEKVELSEIAKQCESILFLICDEKEYTQLGCQALIFKVWDKYCGFVSDCCQEYTLIDLHSKLAVEDICKMVSDRDKTLTFRDEMACALVGTLFNKLRLQFRGTLFWNIPHVSCFVDTLERLRHRDKSEFKPYFEAYRQTKEAVWDFVDKVNWDLVTEENLAEYKLDEEQIKKVLIAAGSKYVEYIFKKIHSFDFEGMKAKLRTDQELSVWLNSSDGKAPVIETHKSERISYRDLSVLSKRFEKQVSYLNEDLFCVNEGSVTARKFVDYFLFKSKFFDGYVKIAQKGPKSYLEPCRILRLLKAVHDRFVDLLQKRESTGRVMEVYREMRKQHSTFEVEDELKFLKDFPPYSDLGLAQTNLGGTIDLALKIVQHVSILPDAIKTLKSYEAVAEGDVDYDQLTHLVDRQEDIREMALSEVVESKFEIVRTTIGTVPTQYWEVMKDTESFSTLEEFFRKYENDFDDRKTFVSDLLRSDSPDQTLLNDVILAHRYFSPLLKRQSMKSIVAEVKTCDLSCDAATEVIKTVHDRIDQVKLLFEQATTESARKMIKDVTHVVIHLNGMAGRKSTFNLIAKKKPTVDVQVRRKEEMGNEDDGKQQKEYSEEEAKDLRRFLVFDSEGTKQDSEGTKQDSSVSNFLSTLQLADRVVKKVKDLEGRGNPFYQNTQVEVTFTNDDLKQNELMCDRDLRGWEKAVRDLRHTNRIFYLLSETQIMSMLILFTKEMSCKLILLAKLSGKSMDKDQEESINTKSAMLVAGFVRSTGFKFVNDGYVNHITESMLPLKNNEYQEQLGALNACLTKLVELPASERFNKQLYYCTPLKAFNSPEVLNFLLQIFLSDRVFQPNSNFLFAFPSYRQICWLSQDTTSTEVKDCIARMKEFPEKKFVFVGVDKLLPNERNLLEEIQRQQACDTCRVSVCYLYFDSMDIPNCEDDQLRQIPDVGLQDLKFYWEQCTKGTKGPKVVVVGGLPLSGKTNFIYRHLQVSQACIHICINDSLDVEQIIQQLNSGDNSQDILITLSLVASFDDANKMLFDLLLSRSLSSVKGGICYSWPQHFDKRLIIEVPCQPSASFDKPWDGVANTLKTQLSVAVVTSSNIYIVVDEASAQKDGLVSGQHVLEDLNFCVEVNRFSHDADIKIDLEIFRDFVIMDSKDSKRNLASDDDNSVVNWIVKWNAANVRVAQRSAAAKSRYIRQCSTKLEWLHESIKNDKKIRLDLFDHIFRECDYLCKARLDCSQLKEYTSFVVPSFKKDDVCLEETRGSPREDNVFPEEENVCCKEDDVSIEEEVCRNEDDARLKEDGVCLVGDVRPGRVLAKIAKMNVDREEISETQIIAFMLGVDTQRVGELLLRWNFILTADVTFKMVLLHHRMKAGIPVIIEGETGVGKTYLLEMYTELLNARQAPGLSTKISQWIKEDVIPLIDTETDFDIDDVSSKDFQKKLQQVQDGDESVVSLFEKLLKKHCNQTLKVKIVDNLKSKITDWYGSIPLLKPIPLNVEELLNESCQLPKLDEQACRLLRAFLATPIYRTFEKLLLHPGISPRRLKEFLRPVITAAEELLDKSNITIVVFLDELNTCKCLGTLKEIICDHQLDGTPLPKNIFFTAAINPFTPTTTEEYAKSEAYDTTTLSVSSVAHRRVYHVFQLLGSMEDYVWFYRGMKEDALKQYLKAKTDVALKSIVSLSHRKEDSKMEDHEENHIKELRLYDRLVFEAHTFCETRLGVGSVSQRDIKRVFELVTFFWNYLPMFWNTDGDTTDAQNLVVVALQLAVGIVYYLRLPLDQDGECQGVTRSSFAAEIDKVMRTENGIENIMTTAIQRFVTKKNFRFSKAVALTRGLCENIFTIVACVISKVPLGIIGTPGSSKTLSVHIVRDNLRGNQSHTEFCKKLPPIDVIAHQCSEYSTSEEIKKTFEKAEKRQKSYGTQTEFSTRCLVFLDEAGLPKENLMVLKVIHPFLDNPKVSFVAISNFAFDAANTNRMVTLRRSLDKKDLEVLALGCLGLTDVDENSKVCQFAKGLAQGFCFVRMDPAFRKMFHYRDFIYTLLYISANRYIRKGWSFDARSSVPDETVVLNALEENMNGVGQQEFRRLFEIFFDGLQALFGREYAVLRETRIRSETEILATMLNRSANKSLASEDRFGSRFLMIIDPAQDETSTIRMLFGCGLLRDGNDRRKIQLLTLSDFTKDVTSLADTETLAKMRFALDTPCTAVLQNTSRIHGALYDLFNQTFSIMAEAKIGGTKDGEESEGKSVYATIAIGELTYPCRVNPNFKCVVLIQEHELASTPSPFLSRFSKFRLSAENFLELQLEESSNVDDRNLVSVVKSKVFEFVECVGQNALFGISNKDFAISQIILCYFVEEVKGIRSKSCGQANLDKKLKSLLRNHSFEVAFVVSVCARLFQLAPPEIAILGIQNIFEPWRNVFAKIYFEIQEHFSLERLIGALHEDTGNGKLGNKLFLYCRSLLKIQDLCKRFREDHLNDWCVLDGENIVSVDTVKEFLLMFIHDHSRKVALVVVPPRLASQLNKMRVILQLIDDAYEYINGREPRGLLTVPSVNSTSEERQNRSFVLMLPHDSNYECGDTVHPAQFLDGWNTFFVDLSASNEAIDCLKVFVQDIYTIEEPQSTSTAYDTLRKQSSLSKWILQDQARSFCKQIELPRVHKDFENELLGCSRTLHGAKAQLQERTEAMVETMQQCSCLAEITANRFCVIPTIKLAIPVLLRRLALEVYGKERNENICTLVMNALKQPYLTFSSRFLGQLATNFGLSTILDWCSDTSVLENVSSDATVLEDTSSDASASESVKSLIMIIPSPCKELELPLLHHCAWSVKCDVHKPYKTPMLETLAGWLERIVSEETERTANEKNVILRSCQARIDALLDVGPLVRTIEENRERRSQWIDDLIRRQVIVDGALDVDDDVFSACNTFVTINSNEALDQCSKFLAAFWTVHCNARTLIYVVRGCRALHHLELLSSIEFEENEAHQCEISFWLQTLETTNKALIDGKDKIEWMAAVSLVLSAFSYLSRFQSNQLHAAMRFMLLFKAISRASGMAVETNMLDDAYSTITNRNGTYRLARILKDLSSISQTSELLSENIKSLLSEVLFLYSQYPSVRKRQEESAFLRDGLANGFKLHGTGHECMTVRLDYCTISSLLRIQNVIGWHDVLSKEFEGDEELVVHDETASDHALLSKLLTTDNEVDIKSLQQQASENDCIVLSTVLRLFPVLKELRTTILSLASFQKWIYEELQFYAESVEESLEQVIDRFLCDPCCSSTQKDWVADGMESISRATSTLALVFTVDETEEAKPKIQSLPLKFCLRTQENNSNGILSEIVDKLGSVQTEVITVLRRYIEDHDGVFDWKLLYGDPAFRYSTSLSQIVATEGSTLISINEGLFRSVIRYCSDGEDGAVIDFHRLEKLVIEMFLGSVRDIDMSTLSPTVSFTALGQIGSQVRSLTEKEEKDVEEIVELWLSCLLKSNDLDNDVGNAEETQMKNDVRDCLSVFDQEDAEYSQRLQPYRAARITLRDNDEVLAQFSNQPICETLKKKLVVDSSFAGSLLSRLPDAVKGKHCKTVLELIVRKESGIGAERYKNKIRSERLWSAAITDDDDDANIIERKPGNRSDQLITKPSDTMWKPSVDYSPAGMSFAELIVEYDSGDDSNLSSAPADDVEEDTEAEDEAPSSDPKSDAFEFPEIDDQKDNINIYELIDKHALNLWKEDECEAQAAMKYLVSRKSVFPQTPIFMEDLLTDQNNDCFVLHKGLRNVMPITREFLCRRCDVWQNLPEIGISESTASNEWTDYYFTNSVGLVLTEQERPRHESPHCSLYFVETTVHVVIQLQLWRQDTLPIENDSFATMERDFASQSTLVDLMAAVLWYAKKFCEQSIDFSKAILHNRNGIVAETTLTVMDIETELRSGLYCTFECPYLFQYKNFFDESISVLPTCFKQSLLTSCRKGQLVDQLNDIFLLWNCQVGTAVEDIIGEEVPVYSILLRSVFSIALTARGSSESNQFMNLPLLCTSTLESIFKFTRGLNDEEDQSDSQQWQLQKVATNKTLQRLAPIPLGWSCCDRTKLVLDDCPLLPKILLISTTEDAEFSTIEVVWRQKPAVSSLLEFFCFTLPPQNGAEILATKASCLVDAGSDIVLTDNDDLITKATAREQTVMIGRLDVVNSCRLPVYRYNYMSKERSLPERSLQYTLTFMVYPNSTRQTSWEAIRDFLALRQHSVIGNTKGPFQCGCFPFLTFSSCQIIINIYTDFQQLMQSKLSPAIGFWEVLKPDDLIPIEVSLPNDFLLFDVTRHTASEVSVMDLQNLLKKLCGCEEIPSFLTSEGEEVRLPESLKLDDALTKFDEARNVCSEKSFKLCLKFSTSLSVSVKLEGSRKSIDMSYNISVYDAVVKALRLFDVIQYWDKLAVSACDIQLESSIYKESFFNHLKEREIAGDSTFEIEIQPKNEDVWVGRLGYQHLEQLSHPYYSAIHQFRMKAAETLGLDSESCRLVVGEGAVMQSVDRLEEVLEFCTRRQFVRSGKPIVYFTDSSMSVGVKVSPTVNVPSEEVNVQKNDNQRLQWDSFMEDLISKCSSKLWRDDECQLLAVKDKVNVHVSTATNVKAVERVCTDDNEDMFTVGYPQNDYTKKLRIFCRRSDLEEKITEDRRCNATYDESSGKLILASQDGLVLRSNETPYSKFFVVLESDCTCSVTLNFRNFRKSMSDDWNYSSLFRGHIIHDKSNINFTVERRVSTTCTIQTVANMAVMLWCEHIRSTNVPSIVIHFDDGSVPDPNKRVADLSEAERSNLWCSVGCQHTITIMETTTTVVPDHLPYRVLQNTCVDDFFVWPSYRMLIAGDQSSCRTVLVLPRSKKAVFVATVIKEDGAKQHLAVTATTKCRSVLQYLSEVNDGSALCLNGLRIEGMASESRLLPPSLPLGHVQCPDGTLTLHLFDESYDGKNDVLKSAEKKDLTVSGCLKKECASTTQKPFGKCLVDPVTCCRLPYNRSDFPIVQSVKRRDNSMRSLNLRDVEIVQSEETVDIELDAYRYSMKGLQVRSDTDTVKVSIHNRKSAIVEWQAVAAFVGSTVDITGKGPFNCARPPFLALRNCNSESSLLMPNPQLVVENLIKLVETSEHYKLHVGFWGEVETAPLIAITVIQSYRPFVTTQFQALRSQVDKLTVGDVIEAVSLQTGESLSTCIVKHCDDHFKRNDSLSKAVEAQGLVDTVKCLCLKLEILEQVNVRVTFDCQHRNICRNEQVCVALSDKTDEIIKKSLTKFDVEHADPELFQLKFDREDGEEETFVESSDSFQTILKKLKLNASCEVSCTMKQKKTLQVKVQLNDEEILEERIEHPLFYTIQEFLDDRATHLKAKGLDSITIASDIDMYVSHDSFDDPVWIVPSNERFDAMIEQLGIGNQKESITIIIVLRDPN